MQPKYVEHVVTRFLSPNTATCGDNGTYITLVYRKGYPNAYEPMLFLGILKKSALFRFITLFEMAAYDKPWNKERFTILYFLLSTEYNLRVCIKFKVSSDATFKSASTVYPSANWSEREICDMFGIHFQDNSDLRRLLNDYGFEGYPLRKDFPLTGYIEVRYDDESQTMLYETVELSQEFRVFISSSPWEKTIR